MSLRTTIAAAVGAAALAGGVLAFGGVAQADPLAVPSPDTASTLTLINGWVNSPYGTGTAAISTTSGIATFRGALSGGTSAEPFVLPAAFRPAADVYVAVDLCNAANGRLLIQSTGDVTIQPETDFSDAQCFTSLEGVSYAVGTAGYRNLGLINGWTGAPFSTRTPATKVISGVVHFQGSIQTPGTNSQPFKLPASLRPAADVYVKVDTCNSTNGRLYIQPTGAVTVMAESDFSNAACFTSLDGVTYPLAAGGTTLTPLNGWVASPFSTRAATASVVTNVVHLTGSIGSGASGSAFKLPRALRPNRNVYVPVDTCNATNARLLIARNGDVSVQALTDLTNAQCFTSLEGVLYRLS